MKNVLTFVTTTAFCCGLVTLGLAEDKTASKSPDKGKVETKADTSVHADLRAKLHRTMAALIEGQAAEEPEQAQIDKLTKKLQQLREKAQAQAPAAAGDQLAGWTCPRGGRGRGYGHGAAWGGPGQGQGAGRGPGGGRGFGPGGGLGLGAGRGAFVDEDHDGICDYYELQHEMHK